jgi:hypothetical protein
MGGQEIDID